MQAIILVGGLGTRLHAVLPNLPKPMAPIHNKPFLAYLLEYLKVQGITKVVLSVHYLKEKIEDFFQSDYAGIEIQYAPEEELLGTGGAIVNALSKIDLTTPVFVLNGDTFVKLNYQAMYQQHIDTNASLTMALRLVPDSSRYGKAIMEDEIIIGFNEKGESRPGLINAGAYLLNPVLFSSFDMPKRFSFEREFLFPYLNLIKPRAFITQDYFIDIGIPEDYFKAMHDFAMLA